MDATAVALTLGALIVGASVLGVLWKATTGRVRHGNGARVSIPGLDLADRVTLLQFSSEVCAPCRSTARILEDVAASTAGVAHVELDIVRRPDLAAQFNVLQTPTTFVLDRDGAVRARIGGAVRRADLLAELEPLVAA